MNSDDGKGMSEGINERHSILTTHYVLLGRELETRARGVQYYGDYSGLVNYGYIRYNGMYGLY